MKGFTLIELIIIVMIIAILASVAIPYFTGQPSEQTKETTVI